jgi:hypothetical protein
MKLSSCTYRKILILLVVVWSLFINFRSLNPDIANRKKTDYKLLNVESPNTSPYSLKNGRKRNTYNISTI